MSNKEKSNIGKNEWLDGTIICSYFGGSNNIFANCTSSDRIGIVRTLKEINYILQANI